MTPQPMDRREYVEERRFLAEREAEAYRGFDKALLLLSSGAILLSMNYITNLRRIPCPSFLVLAWILWAVSIFLQLRSYNISTKAMREEQKILNEWSHDISKDRRENPYDGIPTKYNTAAFATFAGGVVMFFVFVLFSIIRF